MAERLPEPASLSGDGPSCEWKSHRHPVRPPMLRGSPAGSEGQVGSGTLGKGRWGHTLVKQQKHSAAFQKQYK